MEQKPMTQQFQQQQINNQQQQQMAAQHMVQQQQIAQQQQQIAQHQQMAQQQQIAQAQQQQIAQQQHLAQHPHLAQQQMAQQQMAQQQMQQQLLQQHQQQQMAAQQQMMLCPIRVVYEPMLMQQGGDQMQQNQAIFLNPQNPPPWARPVQNQVIYVQQMPNNMVQMQQSLDPNMLVQQNFIYPQMISMNQGLQEIRQMPIQLPNQIQPNIIQNMPQNNEERPMIQMVLENPQMNQNISNVNTNQVTVQAVPNPNRQNTINVQNPHHTHSQNPMTNVKPPDLPKQIMYRQIVPQNQAVNRPMMINQMNTQMRPIQNVNQTFSNVRQTVQQNVTPNTIQQYVNSPNIKIEKTQPTDVNPKTIGIPMYTIRNNQPYGYRAIQPRPTQFRHLPNLLPMAVQQNQFIQRPVAPNMNPSTNQNDNIPKTNTISTGTVKNDTNTAKKRKSESPEIVHKKLPTVFGSITVTPKLDMPSLSTVPRNVNNSTDIGVNTSPVHKVDERTIARPNLAQKTNINHTNVNKEILNKIARNQIERNEVKTSLDASMQTDKDKQIRNTVFTQARGRLLNENKPIIQNNVSNTQGVVNSPNVNREARLGTENKTNFNISVVKMEKEQGNTANVAVSSPYMVNKSIDAQVSSAFTVNTPIVSQVSSPFTVNTPIASQISSPSTVNTSIAAQVSSPFTVNTSMAAQVSSPFTVNTPVAAQVSSPFTVNTSIAAQVSSPFTVNTSMAAQVSSPFTVNTPVAAQVSSPFTVNTSIAAQVSSPFIVNTSMAAQVSSPFTVNTPVAAQVSSPFTVNPPIAAQVSSPVPVKEVTLKQEHLPMEIDEPTFKPEPAVIRSDSIAKIRELTSNIPDINTKQGESKTTVKTERNTKLNDEIAKTSESIAKISALAMKMNEVSNKTHEIVKPNDNRAKTKSPQKVEKQKKAVINKNEIKQENTNISKEATKQTEVTKKINDSVKSNDGVSKINEVAPMPKETAIEIEKPNITPSKPSKMNIANQIQSMTDDKSCKVKDEHAKLNRNNAKNRKDYKNISSNDMKGKEIQIVDGSVVKEDKEYVLTHVLDGYVIQESNVPFAIRKPLTEKVIPNTPAKEEIKKETLDIKTVDIKGEVVKENVQDAKALLELSTLNIDEKVKEEDATADENDNPFKRLKPSAVKLWTIDQLSLHLSKHNWMETISILQEHEIDGESLFLASKPQLLAIGVSETHADLICDFVKS